MQSDVGHDSTSASSPSLSRFETASPFKPSLRLLHIRLDWTASVPEVYQLKCTTGERHIAIYGGKMLLIRECSC